MHKTAPGRSLLDLAAIVILALETAVVAVIAVGYVVYALLDAEFSGLGVALAVVAAIMAVGAGFFTWGYARRRRFALGGALTWQLMQASVGVWVMGAQPVLGVALVATAAVVVAAVLRRQAAQGAQEPEA